MRNIDATEVFEIQKLKGDIQRAHSKGEDAEELYDKMVQKMTICEGSTSTMVYDPDMF